MGNSATGMHSWR